MKQKPSILFITTSSLAANPRLVKEFEYLKTKQRCIVLCYEHIDWSAPLSNTIVENNPEIDFIVINRQKNIVSTVLSKLKHKLAIVLNPFFKHNYKIISYASNDKASQLWSSVKRIGNHYNVNRVVAHNLGAFYPAVKFAKRMNCKLQLDIEDYYPGEAFYFNKRLEKSNRIKIMQHSFSLADTITYASKGIELACDKVFKTKQGSKNKTIINAFMSEDFTMPKSSETSNIRCVWFSQNIGPNRGLEQMFETAKEYKNIEFHLVGSKNQDYIDTIDLSKNVFFHNIMPQEKLHQFLSSMDIGLALENKVVDGNRDICLTNKFLAYAQAGLYILATDTFGQRHFIEEVNYNLGKIINDNLSLVLKSLDLDELKYENKLKRWEHAQSFSWEIEREKLNQIM